MSPILAPIHARRRRRPSKLPARRPVRPQPDEVPVGAARLTLLLHRRWAPAILAELLRGDTHPGGCKFITLAKRLALSRASLSATLEHLLIHDFVMRNPGVGHPMRPEYLLAEQGHDIAPHCRSLLDALRARGLEAIALRKWSLPVLFLLGAGLSRFGELKAALPGITSRSLALALKDLAGAGLVKRQVTEAYPPGVRYQLGPGLGRVRALLWRIAAA